jgi:bacillithiol system protein YtxJ
MIFPFARRTPSTPSTRPQLPEIQDQAALDRALGSERAIVYKHSTRCIVSSWSFKEVRSFAENHPDWPVYVLKVIEERRLSDAAAEQLGIRHQSPQAFVIRDGECVWNGSHSEISEDELSRQID